MAYGFVGYMVVSLTKRGWLGTHMTSQFSVTVGTQVGLTTVAAENSSIAPGLAVHGEGGK